MVARVLVIERNQVQNPSFSEALKKRYEVFTAPSGRKGLALAGEFSPGVIVLDAISMRTPGDRVCQLLREHLPTTPLVHLFPGDKRKAQSCAEVVLTHPFTARKLINSIERLLQKQMAPQTGSVEAVVCGPFALDMSRRVLRFQGQETALTPKLAQLIEIFMRHPGQTLDRKMLMSQVWNTDYLGDTRTLDVHIRYIRQAVESDPSKPVYFKTVRGIGYRLEIGGAPAAVLQREMEFQLT